MRKLLGLMVIAILCAGATEAFSANYILHLGGMCSKQWVEGSGVRVSNASGYTSVNCVVDSTVSIAYSASQFKANYLDVYCTGSNWCYIVNYSAGDAIMGYINANYPANWNVAYVYTSAGAGGGSEIAIKGLAGIFACKFANDLGVSTVRNMYNHNDTNGITVYRIGGYDGWWYSSAFLPGEDDGAVAYHSSGGCVSSGSYTSLCKCTHWTNHVIAYTCSGYDLDHYGMKMKFISLKGW